MIMANSIEAKLKEYKFIIFGSDHYQTLGVIRSLGKKGLRPDVILHPKYSDHPFMCPNSRYVGEVHIVDSVADGYILLLEKYGNEKLKPFLYTCDDWTEGCLDMHYGEIIDKFNFFNGHEKGCVLKYMDKDNISKLAMQCGCRIPKSETLNKGQLPTSLKYPIITKSIMSTTGAWKNDSRICYSPNELMENYKTIKSDVLLVEEFIEKKNELCLGGFAVNNGKDICLPYQATYLRLSPKSYSNYMVIEPLRYRQVKQQVTNILSKVGFNGIFSVEFLIGKDEQLYFLEVNFRNSTWSYAYTVGGVNLPYEWAKATLLGNLKSETIRPRKKPYKAIAEFTDYVQFVSTKKISKFEWIKNVITADCRFYILFSDPKPTIAGVIMKIKRKFK